MIKFGVSKLRFRDGSSETIPADGVTVVVGANNTGKSLLLREIRDFVTRANTQPASGQPEPLWLSGLDIAAQATEDEFADWFKARSRISAPNAQFAGQEVIALPDSNMPNYTIRLDDAWQCWQLLTQTEMTKRDYARVHQALTIMTQHLVSLQEAMGRGNLLGNGSAREPMTPATHPYHRLWDSIDEEDDLSDIIFRSFGFHVCINRYTQNLQLLVGDPKKVDRTEFPPTRPTLDYYASLHAVDQQGDGVRSFVGLLIRSILTNRSITLIDEPEAFLHPPQARLLGRYLLTHIPTHHQIIVATHSSDIVEGLLNDNSAREVKIIRLDRAADSAGVHNSLPPAKVATLWKDPLLRYSRMLDGLFHKGVVICEADNDCRFYTATLESYLSANIKKEHDLIFTHTGGKHRIPEAFADLRSFEIRVAAIVDLDALDETGYMKRAIEAAGGEFEEFKHDLETVQLEVKRRTSPPSVRDIKELAKKLVGRRDNSPISEDEVRALRDATKNRSGWVEVKRSGIRAFSGESHNAIQRILDGLAKLGIFLVEVGELESWFPEVEASHGGPYVTLALEQNKHRNPTSELRDFIAKIANYFSI